MAAGTPTHHRTGQKHIRFKGAGTLHRRVQQMKVAAAGGLTHCLRRATQGLFERI